MSLRYATVYQRHALPRIDSLPDSINALFVTVDMKAFLLVFDTVNTIVSSGLLWSDNASVLKGSSKPDQIIKIMRYYKRQQQPLALRPFLTSALSITVGGSATWGIEQTWSPSWDQSEFQEELLFHRRNQTNCLRKQPPPPVLYIGGSTTNLKRNATARTD